MPIKLPLPVLLFLVALVLSACVSTSTPSKPKPAARATPTPLSHTCDGVECDGSRPSDLGCRSVGLANPGQGTSIAVLLGKDEVGSLYFEGNLEDQRLDDRSVIGQSN